MPAITTISLTIGASNVPLSSVLLNEVEIFNRDETRRFSFTRDSVLPEADTWIGDKLELIINNVIEFTGVVRNRRAVFSDDRGVAYAYEALGTESLMDDWPVVSPFDGTGSVTFNANTTDPNYDPTYDGKTLGEMIRTVLEEPSTRNFLKLHNIGRFNNAGAIDSRTVADLAAGYFADYRPNTPVTFAGDQLLQTIRAIIQSAAPNYRIWFQTVKEPPPDAPNDPVQTWLVIRFADLRSVASTLNIDLALNPQPQLNRSTADNYSRVIVRGGPDIRPVILDLSAGDLAEAFAMPPTYTTNTAAKTAWNIGTWLNASRKQITGTCLCRRPRTANEADPGHPSYIADPTSTLLADANYLLVDPADNTLTWAADAYNQSSNGLAGFLYVERNQQATWIEMINRKVVSNTALTAGGTAYLQLDDPLPSTDYVKFTMIPGIWPGSLTWRRYSIQKQTGAGRSIAKYAQPAFPVPIPWTNTDGTLVGNTQTAVATIYFTPAGSSEQRFAMCNIQVDRLNEAIILDRPSVSFFGQPSSLATGGVSVDGQPQNIRALIPVSLKPLEVIEPVNTGNTANYSGTSFTVDGVARTHFVNMPDWVAESDTSPIRLWAKQLLDSIKDTVVEGQTVLLTWEPIRQPGVKVTFSDACLPAGSYSQYETAVYSCLLRFAHGNGPVPYLTELALSNRRDQCRGYDATLHPIVAAPPKQPRESIGRAGSLLNRPESVWQNQRASFVSALDRSES